MHRTALFALAALALGCGSSDVDAPAAAEAKVSHPPVIWGPCPEGSGYLTEPTAECATIDMPLDHKHPERGTIPYFIARLPAVEPDGTQLWWLDGGPGSSGEEFFDLQTIEEYAAVAPNADIYLPAHRGTGFSNGIFCSAEAPGTDRDVEISPGEWPGCVAEVVAAHGADLAYYNVTQAAADLGEAIDRLRGPGHRVFVYGLSYGTTLAIRYLHAYPHQADGVILDSIVSPGAEFQSRADTYFDPVLQRYAALCAADAGCAARMGPDPVAKIAAVEAALDGGHCAAAGIDRPALRQILAGSLMGFHARLFALTVPYRLERCDPADVDALQLFNEIWFSPPFSAYGFSHAVEANISFNEIWEKPAPSQATLIARAEGALASFDWAKDRAPVYPVWPKYTASPDPTTWPKTSVPMLMLNGTLDGETPIELASLAAQHWNKPHQTFVTMPNVPHGASYQSPDTLGDFLPCGVKILGSFMANPKADPDTSCLAALEPVTFENQRFAKFFFGSGSMWDNTPITPAAPPAPGPTALVPRGRGKQPLLLR